ncbi:MAG: hypothetical protein AMXMBFR33_55270 [Candidatus Xenobia bacterium]
MDPLLALQAASGLNAGGCCACSGPMMGNLGAAQNRLMMNPMAPMAGMDPLMQMMNQQMMLTQYLFGLLMGLMLGRMGGNGMMPGMEGLLGGGPLGGVGGGGGPLGGGGSVGGGGGVNTGGGGAPIPTGPVAPGVEGMLDKARSMIGMHENRDTSAIQSVTGKSGINPASTPWCAAWAMNLLKDHGVLNLDGLSNRNYCPTIKSWAQNKGIWGNRGQYNPKPGDAILFDWQGDGTVDHIGIVESVNGGKVTTIEGNSSDSVKRNSYDIGSSKISGYVITGTGK